MTFSMYSHMVACEAKCSAKAIGEVCIWPGTWIRVCQHHATKISEQIRNEQTLTASHHNE